MEFTLLEKLAVIKAVDEVLIMDEEIKEGEVQFMDRLANTLDFDDELLAEARNTEPAEALAVLRAMSDGKKKTLARLLTQAANSDGEVDEREIRYIYRVLAAAGIEHKI